MFAGSFSYITFTQEDMDDETSLQVTELKKVTEALSLSYVSYV